MVNIIIIDVTKETLKINKVVLWKENSVLIVLF